MSSEGEKEKKESRRELPKYSWEEVAQHNSAESLWIVVQDKIYDVTKFMEEVLLKIKALSRHFNPSKLE
jgi:cytochrome b involved in lipid metabolism